MHFPNHVRQSLLDWLDARLPGYATVEENYVCRKVPAPDLLRGFLVPVDARAREQYGPPPHEVWGGSMTPTGARWWTRPANPPCRLSWPASS